jgi:hypothetical protein
MTVQQLITASLQDLRIIQTGETASADDSTFALSRLNDWINSLATEDLTVYTITRKTWTLSTAASYTIGSGGTIDVARPTGPMAISNIGFQDTSVSPVIEYNLGPVLTEDGYAAIAQKALTSVYPQNFYYNPTYTSGLGVHHPVSHSDQHHAARGDLRADAGRRVYGAVRHHCPASGLSSVPTAGSGEGTVECL